MKKFVKWLTAGLLAASLAIGAVMPAISAGAAAAIANAEPQRTVDVNYVALGDSMTTGYGFELHENGGFLNDCEWNYPTQVKLQLEELHKDWNVHLAQMATVAMRSEELYFMLEYDHENGKPRFEGDSFTWDNWLYKYICVGMDETERAQWLKYMSKTYQEEIAKADYISLNLGSNSFGNFFLNNLLTAVQDHSLQYEIDLGKLLLGETPIMQTIAENAYKTIRAILLKPFKAENSTTVQMVEQIGGSLIYSYVSMLKSYKANLDDILRLHANGSKSNKQLNITLMGMCNIMSNTVASIKGISIDFGKVLAAITSVLNSDIAKIAASYNAEVAFKVKKPYKINFIAAYEDELGNKNDTVENFYDDFRNIIYEPMREEFLQNTESKVWADIHSVFPEALQNYYDGSLSNMETYREYYDEEGKLIQPLTGKKGFTLAIYRIFEEAIIEISQSKQVFELDSWLGLSENNIAAELLKAGGMSELFADLATVQDFDDYVFSEEFISAIAQTLAKIPTARISYYIGAKFFMGSSKAIHPNKAGHKAYATSIVNSFEAGARPVQYFAQKAFNVVTAPIRFAVNAVKTVLSQVFAVWSRVF